MSRLKRGKTLQLKDIQAAREVLSQESRPYIAFLYEWELDWWVIKGFITSEEKETLLKGGEVKGMRIYPKRI